MFVVHAARSVQASHGDSDKTFGFKRWKDVLEKDIELFMSKSTPKNVLVFRNSYKEISGFCSLSKSSVRQCFIFPQ